MVVRDNTADVMGGGVWCCPTGHSTVHVTEGVAIFDNKATSSEDLGSGAGDDLVTCAYSEDDGVKVSISTWMLGGVMNRFFVDGNIYLNSDPNKKDSTEAWFVDQHALRFDADSPGDAVKLDGTAVSRALKSMPTEGTKAAANASLIQDRT